VEIVPDEAIVVRGGKNRPEDILIWVAAIDWDKIREVAEVSNSSIDS
jgi:hypothetical protein